MSIKTLSLLCPTCKKQVLMTPEFPERPFCSKRCKLIDLGEWASENYKLASDPLEDMHTNEEDMDRNEEDWR